MQCPQRSLGGLGLRGRLLERKSLLEIPSGHRRLYERQGLPRKWRGVAPTLLCQQQRPPAIASSPMSCGNNKHRAMLKWRKIAISLIEKNGVRVNECNRLLTTGDVSSS